MKEKKKENWWTKLAASQYYAFLTIAFRLIVGGIFVIASYHKILDTPAFAVTVEGYDILPDFLVTPFSYALAYAELIFGLMLIVGYKTRFASVMMIVMLVVFIIAIGINMARGEEEACGCFGVEEGGTELGWKTIIRDIIFLVMSFHILLGKRFPFSVDSLLAKRQEK